MYAFPDQELGQKDYELKRLRMPRRDRQKYDRLNEIKECGGFLRNKDDYRCGCLGAESSEV